MDRFLTLLNSDLKVSELLLSSDGPERIFDHVSGGDGWAFLLISAFGLAMALVYIPIRLFLTITARSRRLKLLQRIRKLREVIAEPIDNNS
ncbi:MAG: hypothetical protein ACK535_03265 [Cyanobacteriota bacterium]|jgi:hypothetical protein